MKLAYLTPQYPKVSHTFIRRELKALEALGHSVQPISIRSAESSTVVDPADEAEIGRTEVLLSRPERLAGSVLEMLGRRPLRSLSVLAKAIRVGLASGSGLIRPVAYFVEACVLVSLCRERGIEHVHVHFGTNGATVALLARRLGGAPFSVALHGPDEWDAPERHLIREKIAEGSFTTVISSYARAQAMRWSSADDWMRLHEIHCTVDEAFFAAASPIAEGDERVFVCVGRLTAQKGPLLLVEAVARLLEEGAPVRLVFAGGGELETEVRAEIARRGIGERVRVTGWIDERAVRDALRTAHCLVLPSFAEGLPVVIMEALALQRPVLSTYVAGIPELVRPGENGWLVPAGDVEALVRALREIAKTPIDTLQRMGEAGAQAVRERHRVATEAGKLSTLLAQSRLERG